VIELRKKLVCIVVLFVLILSLSINGGNVTFVEFLGGKFSNADNEQIKIDAMVAADLYREYAGEQKKNADLIFKSRAKQYFKLHESELNSPYVIDTGFIYYPDGTVRVPAGLELSEYETMLNQSNNQYERDSVLKEINRIIAELK
jgi:hypothetical protein